MANDLTEYVVSQLSGELDVLRNNFTLTRAVWNHNLRNPEYKGRGKAKWTHRSTGSVETKTEGTGLSRSTGRTITSVELNPTTHKVIRFHVEDGEGALMQIRDYAAQQFRHDIVQLVNTIEAAIAAKQSSLTTNRVGTLGGGITAELLARAKKKVMRDQNATSATLLVSSLVEQDMTLDEDIQAYLAQRNDAASGPQWFLNVFGFNQMGVATNIYSPDTDQHCNLVLAPECIGIAFADLNGEEAGQGRATRPMIDTVTGIPFRVIQGATDDNLGQEFLIDIQYDIEVQEEAMGCVILT